MNMQLSRVEFGRALDWRRLLCGLTHEELGAGADVDPSYVWRLCTGQQMPRLDVALKLARALGCSLDELVQQPSGSRRLLDRARLQPAFLLERMLTLSHKE